jgi:hypothetical protein
MHDQELGAYHRRAIQFSTESRDRPRPDFGIPRSQVHQVIYVDHQGADVVLPEDCLQRFHLRTVGRPGAPHTRARREDLQCIGADFRRPRRRLFKRAERIEMNPQPQTYMLAERRFLGRKSHPPVTIDIARALR